MTRSKSTRKRSASKKKGSVKAAAKSRATTKKIKSAVSARRGVASTAPVVYQTLREQVNAVNTNVGATESLSDFLASTDW